MDPVTDHMDEEEKKWLTPIKIILAIFLVLLLVLMIFPEYSVKLDPEPNIGFSVSNVIPEDIEIIDEAIQPSGYNDFKKLVKPNDPIVKQTADKISSTACSGNKICSAKAMFYFVRDNFDYISDPIGIEYVESPREFLSVGGGDCESGSVTLANLEAAIGIKTQMVFIPGHAYVRIKLDDTSKKYKNKGWIYLDWTCKSCGFGELPILV